MAGVKTGAAAAPMSHLLKEMSRTHIHTPITSTLRSIHNATHISARQAARNSNAAPSRCMHVQARRTPPTAAAASASRTSPITQQQQSRSMATAPTTATDSSVPSSNVRNMAIIAHVDHGKTTLVDCLLRQSFNTKMVQGEQRVMDSNTLERERGITILSKCTSIIYRQSTATPSITNNFQINLIDTPGHADFGGEVERIMSMVDGVILVVDATDGPMTQTRFVLSKALQRQLQIVVVINKVDRPTARLGEVENEIFDLFCALNASDSQMDYPVVYTSAKEGWATQDADVVLQVAAAAANISSGDPNKAAPAAAAATKAVKGAAAAPAAAAAAVSTRPTTMTTLFDTVCTHIPSPINNNTTAPFSLLVTQIDVDPFLGKLLLGVCYSGRLSTGMKLHALDSSNNTIETIRVTKILCRRGLEQVIVDECQAGDVVSIAGFSAATVNSTLCDVTVVEALKSIPIDPPTLSMTFSVNDSPFVGQDGGTKLTSNAIKERLVKEAETNVSLQIVTSELGESFEVRGRGELQLGILIETMRREGYELSISAPKVVYRKMGRIEWEQEERERRKRESLAEEDDAATAAAEHEEPDADVMEDTDDATATTAAAAAAANLESKSAVSDEGAQHSGASHKHNPLVTLEPLETVVIDVPDEYSGSIIEKLSQRKAELLSFEQTQGAVAKSSSSSGGAAASTTSASSNTGEGRRSKLTFVVPMRGLIGYRSELQNETKGLAVMNTSFNRWSRYQGDFVRVSKGALISTGEGKVTGFALETLQERGVLFVKVGDAAYVGMVVGENAKDDDMEVNPVKSKALSNVRTTSKDEYFKLTPSRVMSLEEVIAYVRDDEVIEVTPKSIRLRKKALDPNERKKHERSKKMRSKA